MDIAVSNLGSATIGAWSSGFHSVEFADNASRAIITLPVIHVGANKKGLMWTEEMVKRVVPLFQGITFRYDIDGQEGSSHTPKKLFSPHFDVGWTYGGERGAWYDDKTQALWVKGEVTHPAVVEKLQRMTTDGKREINFASMGVLVDKAVCSICGHEFNQDGCDHIRNEKYGDQTCYSVPTEINKALHVALTNDPADGEAEIKECIFQDMTEDQKNRLADRNIEAYGSRPTPKGDDYRLTANKFEQSATNIQKIQNSTDDKVVSNMNDQTNQMVNGMAPAAPINAAPGANPSPQELLVKLAERIKTLESAINMQKPGVPGVDTPEVINQAQNAGATQDNMGVTSQIDKSAPTVTQATENKQKDIANANPAEKKGVPMETKDGQLSNQKTPVNPSDAKVKAELQDATAPVGGDKLDQILSLLQQLVAQKTAMADESELLNAGKSKVEGDGEETLGHTGPGETVSPASEQSEGNKKNKEAMQKPGELADNSEILSLKAKIAKMEKAMELADSELPEFGHRTAETADSSYGSYRGKYAAIEGWRRAFPGDSAKSI